MRLKLKCAFLTVLALAVSAAWADTLELKNGSLIKGKFVSGTETEINFQVGSTTQTYNVADIVSLKFEPEGAASALSRRRKPAGSSLSTTLRWRRPQVEQTKPAFVSIPAGTRISVRTIEAIDSSTSMVGDKFEASLEGPMSIEGRILVPDEALVYGRLTEAKESGTFAGRSQLRLELTGIVGVGMERWCPW